MKFTFCVIINISLSLSLLSLSILYVAGTLHYLRLIEYNMCARHEKCSFSKHKEKLNCESYMLPVYIYVCKRRHKDIIFLLYRNWQKTVWWKTYIPLIRNIKYFRGILHVYFIASSSSNDIKQIIILSFSFS